MAQIEPGERKPQKRENQLELPFPPTPGVNLKAPGELDVAVIGGKPSESNKHMGVLFVNGGIVPSAVLNTLDGIHAMGWYHCLERILEARQAQGLKPDRERVEVDAFRNYVPLIFQGQSPDRRYMIRVEDMDNPGKYLQAVDLLEATGVPNEQIMFLDGGKEFGGNVKFFGGTYRLRPIKPLDEKEVQTFVTQCHVQIGTKNHYWYTPSTGIRRISYGEAAMMLEDLDDKSVFVGRMREVVEYYNKKNRLGNREVDFLRQDENGRLETTIKPSDDLHKTLESVCQDAEARGGWTPTDRQEVKKKFEGFLRQFSGLTNERFWAEMPNDADWRRGMYFVINDIPDQAAVMKLGLEFRGIVTPKPGGFVGHKFEDGTYHLGPRHFEMRQLDEETQGIIKTKMDQNPRANYVVVQPREFRRSDRKDTGSVYTFEVRGPNIFREGERVLERHWVFDKKADAENREMLNWMLETHPSLEYCYTCEVPRSRSKRVKLPEDVQDFGEPAREVLISVSMRYGNAEERKLRRRLKWDTGYWMSRGFSLDEATARDMTYQENVMQRVMGINAIWNMSGIHVRRLPGIPDIIPEVSTFSINVTDQDTSRRELRSYGERDLIDGPPTNRVGYKEYRDFEYVKKLLALKGKVASLNAVTGRVLFDDGDEVLSRFDERGRPVEVMLADPTTSFREVNHPLVEDADLYAVHLAADLTRWHLNTPYYNKPFGGYNTLVRSFCDSFKYDFTRMQDQYRENREWYESFMERLSQGNLAAVRTVETNEDLRKWDLRPRWKKVLKRMDETDVETVAAMMEDRTRKVSHFLSHVTHGVQSPEHQEELINTATDLLSMNFKSKGELSVDNIMEVVANDKTFPRLTPEEKVMRLNAMKITSWITLVGCSPSEVIGYAMECAQRGTTEQDASSFINNVNRRFEKLHISTDMAETLFDIAKTPGLVGELDGKGYILKTSRIA